MTSEPRTVEADARRWAIRTLELEQHGEPFDAAAMLRLATQSDYVLSPEWADAMQIVANPSAVALRSNLLESAAAFGRHQRFREAVASFRQQFFDLPCAERRRRWDMLVSECAGDPVLGAQLRRLEAGLDVEAPLFTENRQHNHLIQTCRNAFLAHAAEAARLRRGFCEMWRGDVVTWENVTDEALEQHRQFFDAVAPWVDEFGDLRWRESLPEPQLDERSRRWLAPYRPTSGSQREGVLPSRWRRLYERVEWWSARLAVWSLVGIVGGGVLAGLLAIIRMAFMILDELRR